MQMQDKKKKKSLHRHELYITQKNQKTLVYPSNANKVLLENQKQPFFHRKLFYQHETPSQFPTIKTTTTP